MTRIAAVALVLAFAACDGSTRPQPAPTSHEVVLRLGQSVPLDGSGITVGLQRVDEDSRCPTSAVCVWEGNGRVTLQLRDTNGVEISAQLNTNPSYARSLVFRYLNIELTALDPYPQFYTANRVDYQVHLRWSYLPD
jgi:hypothetical protein